MAQNLLLEHSASSWDHSHMYQSLLFYIPTTGLPVPSPLLYSLQHQYHSDNFYGRLLQCGKAELSLTVCTNVILETFFAANVLAYY